VLTTESARPAQWRISTVTAGESSGCGRSGGATGASMDSCSAIGMPGSPESTALQFRDMTRNPEHAWSQLGQGTVNDLAARITSCLPPRDGRTDEDSRAASFANACGQLTTHRHHRRCDGAGSWTPPYAVNPCSARMSRPRPGGRLNVSCNLARRTPWTCRSRSTQPSQRLDARTSSLKPRLTGWLAGRGVPDTRGAAVSWPASRQPL
jgi:hypothetical protein